MSDRRTVLICRRLLPAGLDLLVAAGCEIREGGLDATPDGLLKLAPGSDAIVPVISAASRVRGSFNSCPTGARC